MSDADVQKLWTPANKVTLARILAIPLFVIVVISPWPQYFPQWPEADAWKPIIAALVFVVISATDAIDGHLARSRNEVTNLGKFMDPLADKILVTAALLALIELQVLPSWVALIILAREFIVSGIRMVAASEGIVMPASWWGKVKTVTQIIAVVLFLVKGSPLFGTVSHDLSNGLYLFAWAMMIIALFFTIVSMLDYFSKASDLLGFDGSDVSLGKQASSRFADSGDDMAALSEKLVDAVRECGKMIATAESCTGGLVGSAITAVAGSSDIFAGGIISYSNDVKKRRLNVRPETLERYGAVSGETASEMARGAVDALHADIAVSITGIAGPGGATPGKPVGTVWIGLCMDGNVEAHECHFDGSRSEVREQAVVESLKTVLNALKA